MTGKRGIGTAAAIVAGGVLLSRVLGFGRDLTMAIILGRTAETDLYQYAFTIPDFAFYLVAGGFLSITLIPILATRIENGDETARDQAFSAVLRTVGLILGVLTILTAIFADRLVALVFPQVTGDEAIRLVAMTRVALVLQVLFALGALFSAVQFAYRRFLIPTLGPIVYNAGIIAGGVVGHLAGSASPEAFLYGGVAGAAIGSFGLQVWGARRTGLRTVRTGWREPVVGEYLSLALPLMVGQTVIALDEQWPRAFGQFGPDGTTAGLQYARRLMMLPVGVVAQAAGVAAYPFLAGLAARGDETGMRATVDRSIRSALVISVPVTIVVVILAPVWVRLALQWGAFGVEDTQIVAPLLAIYSLAIPFWVMHQVITRAFYARRKMWTPVVVGTSVTAVTIAALVFGSGSGTAIAAISAAAVTVYAVAITAVWYRAVPENDRIDIGRFGVRFASATGVAALAGWLLLAISPVLATVTSIVLFVGVGAVLGIEEIPNTLRRLRAR